MKMIRDSSLITFENIFEENICQALCISEKTFILEG